MVHVICGLILLPLLTSSSRKKVHLSMEDGRQPVPWLDWQIVGLEGLKNYCLDVPGSERING